MAVSSTAPMLRSFIAYGSWCGPHKAFRGAQYDRNLSKSLLMFAWVETEALAQNVFATRTRYQNPKSHTSRKWNALQLVPCCKFTPEFMLETECSRIYQEPLKCFEIRADRKKTTSCKCRFPHSLSEKTKISTTGCKTTSPWPINVLLLSGPTSDFTWLGTKRKFSRSVSKIDSLPSLRWCVQSKAKDIKQPQKNNFMEKLARGRISTPNPEKAVKISQWYTGDKTYLTRLYSRDEDKKWSKILFQL